MHEFIVDRNAYLSRSTRGFFHTSYLEFRRPGNPDFLNFLKNDCLSYNKELPSAKRKLREILINDLPRVKELLQLKDVTVCVVPRAKISYFELQLKFIGTVRDSLAEVGGLEDGTGFIRRHTDTKTTHLTHLKKPIIGLVNEGLMPYPGITSKTCSLSSNIAGKDILLIDDVYTKRVNIDEDAIQALLDMGAKSVAFYAVAKTEGG